MSDKGDSGKPQGKSGADSWPIIVGLIAKLICESYESAPGQKRETAQDKASRRTANATIWIAIFTVVLAVSASLQILVFVESERPFVAMSGVNIAGGGLRAGVPLAFVAAVKNSGKTTAFVIDSRSITRTQPDSLLTRGLKKFMAETTAKGPVVAGDTNNLIIRPETEKGGPVIFEQTAIDQIEKGEVSLWVIGYITYKDRFPIFGITNTTGYCFLYSPHRVDPGLSSFNRCGDEEYEYAK